ncbi:MAG: RNA polymerase sigma factor [Bacillota bacterium]
MIVLYYLEQMNVAQMAALLGASPSAIDVRLHRARQRLKEKLSRFVQE